MSNISILYTEVSGSGSPVLLIPGMLATTKFWKEISEKLSKNHKVISLDILGFGQSPAPKNLDYTISDHTQSILKTLDDLQIKENLIVVGHSMGALLALDLALEKPGLVKKLILISPPIFKSKTEARDNISRFSALHPILLYGNVARITCLIFCNLLRPLTRIGVIFAFGDLPREIAADTLLHNYSSYSKTLENVVENQNFFERISQIKVPIKIIYGENDKRIIQENLEELKKKNPKIEIEHFPNLGHQLPLQDPQIVLNLI